MYIRCAVVLKITRENECPLETVNSESERPSTPSPVRRGGVEAQDDSAPPPPSGRRAPALITPLFPHFSRLIHYEGRQTKGEMFAHSSSAALQGGAAAKCRVISSLEAQRRKCHIPMHGFFGALPAGHLFIRSLMKLFHGGRVCYRPDPNRFMQAMFTTPGIMKATGREARLHRRRGRRGLDSVSLRIRWEATRVATDGAWKTTAVRRERLHIQEGRGRGVECRK